MRGRRELVFLVALVFLIQFASAANVGVSPANVAFKDVLRNGYAERPITVTIDTEKDTKFSIDTRGDISEWFNFSRTNASVSKGKPFQVMLSVSPPSDVPNGNYSGFVIVKSENLRDATTGHATGLIIPTLEVFVEVEITDKEIRNCRATDFQVASAEQGDDIIFTMNIFNGGNIRISPGVNLDVWNQDSTAIVKQESFIPEEIIPTKKNEFLFKLGSSDLEIGQYWVDISVPDCLAAQTLTFDVLEEGALRANGKLQQIAVNPWADIDEIVPISATFKNTGEKSLETTFRGEIKFQNKIVQLLESDEFLFVPMDGQESFQFYFTPRKAGQYIISGRVFYDGKRTYGQSAILNVMPREGFGPALKYASYALLLLVISILLYKIRNERRAYFSKSRI